MTRLRAALYASLMVAAIVATWVAVILALGFTYYLIDGLGGVR